MNGQAWMNGDVYFGWPGKPLPDWRKEATESDTDDDAEPTEEERAAVVAVLGFDPRESDETQTPEGLTRDELAALTERIATLEEHSVALPAPPITPQPITINTPDQTFHIHLPPVAPVQVETPIILNAPVTVQPAPVQMMPVAPQERRAMIVERDADGNIKRVVPEDRS